MYRFRSGGIWSYKSVEMPNGMPQGSKYHQSKCIITTTGAIIIIKNNSFLTSGG